MFPSRGHFGCTVEQKQDSRLEAELHAKILGCMLWTRCQLGLLTIALAAIASHITW